MGRVCDTRAEFRRRDSVRMGMGRRPSHTWWRGREARSRRRLGRSIHDMCMRRQDGLCTRGDAERRLEGWQSGSAGREAERIQDQGQGAGWR